ncbi:PIN domain-containing protein, partial [Planctomycetota bacterium]
MKYVFDSGSLLNLFWHYYPERFPTLWVKFDALVSDGELVSVREVFNEIGSSEDSLGTWAKEQKNILFLESTVEELRFVAEIFQVQHFQAMIRKQERLKGKPVADPFVIAKARIYGAYVVTQEKNTENSAKIPMS